MIHIFLKLLTHTHTCISIYMYMYIWSSLLREFMVNNIYLYISLIVRLKWMISALGHPIARQMKSTLFTQGGVALDTHVLHVLACSCQQVRLRVHKDIFCKAVEAERYMYILHIFFLSC